MKVYVFLCLICPLLAACASSPESAYYKLTPLSPENGPAISNFADNPQSRERFMLGAISMPDMLDRDQIAFESGENTVEFLEYDRWAESLDTMTRRVLADDLSARLGVRWLQFPGTDALPDDRRILVTIKQFDLRRDGEVTLAASWELAPPQETTGVQPVHVFARSEAVSPLSIEGEVAAMSQLLAALSDEIAITALFDARLKP